MSMLRKLSALFRGSAHDAAQGVVDANALKILDQEIRDADNAQGKARDDLAGLVARRRMAENELASFRDQIAKYESSARTALGQGKTDLAREVARGVGGDDVVQPAAYGDEQIGVLHREVGCAQRHHAGAAHG